MHCIRRSCQVAAQRPPSLVSGVRAFSRSTACARGALPVFAESSSPSLSSLLATFNAKVLLPLHLTPEQEKLVYKQANKAKLEAEPVEVTLGDVTLPLEPLDRNHLPDRFNHVRDILTQSQTRDDWANVVRLLEGFENAGLHVAPRWQAMIIRRLNLAGMQSLVLQALQRVRVTGLHLTDYSILLQVLRGLHDKAAVAGWDQEETTQALRMAKQVVDLMEDKDHHAARRGSAPADHRGDPVVIALPTELTAVLAQRHGGDSADLKKLANRLITALVQSNYEDKLKKFAESNNTSSKDLDDSVSPMKRFFAHGDDLVSLVIIWNALKTSRAVLGADMPMADKAQSFEAKAGRILTKGIDSLATLKREGARATENSFLGYAMDLVNRCR